MGGSLKTLCNGFVYKNKYLHRILSIREIVLNRSSKMILLQMGVSVY